MISREQRAAVVRSQHAAHAAAAALLPEGLPAEVSAALHAAEEATDRAAAIASSPVSGSTLQLRLSATVPRVSATLVANALKSETQALSAALGVEVLRPVAFVMGEHQQSPDLDELSSIYKATN
jgi:predicted 2-oxoglutarate/Fe(II)-dependent dioxygenase YbiX